MSSEYDDIIFCFCFCCYSPLVWCDAMRLGCICEWFSWRWAQVCFCFVPMSRNNWMHAIEVHFCKRLSCSVACATINFMNEFHSLLFSFFYSRFVYSVFIFVRYCYSSGPKCVIHCDFSIGLNIFICIWCAVDFI